MCIVDTFLNVACISLKFSLLFLSLFIQANTPAARDNPQAHKETALDRAEGSRGEGMVTFSFPLRRQGARGAPRPSSPASPNPSSSFLAVQGWISSWCQGEIDFKQDDVN